MKDLSTFFASMLEELFPPEYIRVSQEKLLRRIHGLTQALNYCLDEYHQIEEMDVRMRFKPALAYGQALLAHMTRLLRFDPIHLTNSNQILVDLEKMLQNREELIETKYRVQAETELRLVNDQRLRRILQDALHTYFF